MDATPGEDAAAVLRVLAGPCAGSEVEIAPGQPVLIGRAETCGLCLPGRGVSRIHARITLDTSGLRVERLSGINQVYVNGSPRADHRLRLWDTVGLGPHVLRVESLHGAHAVRVLREIDTGASVLACLLEIQRLLSSDADNMVREAMDLLFLALPATRLSLFSIEADGEVRQGHTVARGSLPTTHMSHGFVRHVLDAGRAVLLGEQAAVGQDAWESTLREQNVQAVAGVPVRHGERIAAVLLCDNLEQPGALDHTHLRVLEAVAQSLEHVFQSEELRRMQRERIRGELEFETAQSVQRTLLGRDLAAISGPWRWRAIYKPALKLGGDYFDHGVDAAGLSLIVADVSGKGVGAGIVVGMLRIAYKELWQRGLPPSELLAALDERLRGELPNAMFFTALAVHIARDGTLRWAGMGHPDGVVLRGAATAATLASEPGMFGIMPLAWVRSRLSTRSMQLAAGDRVFLCTDGLTEAMDPAGGMYGPARALEVLAGRAQDPPEKALAAVMEDVARHAAGAEQSDDIALLAGDFTP